MPTEKARPHWTEWGLAEWNIELFEYFFISGEMTSPVFRLSLTSNDFLRLAGEQEEPGEIKEAFLKSIRCPPRVFKSRVSDADLTDGQWRGSAPPPFFVYLVFTCFAAASVDADTVSVGDFRERIRILLGHSVGTQYPLPGLAALWIAFKNWLEESRRHGSPYRSLVLPDPGRMNRIGFSIGLAFPHRRDRLRLIEILGAAALGREPPIAEILTALGPHVHRFSGVFQDTYTKARRAYTKRLFDSAELDTLIAAANEAIIATPPSGQDPTTLDYKLVLETNDLFDTELALLCGSKPSTLTGGIEVLKIDTPLPKFPWLVALKGRSGSLRLIDLLFAGSLDDKLPSLGRSVLRRAIKQGVLLFSQNQFGTHEVVFSRPSEGAVRAIVRNDLMDAFSRIVPHGTALRDSLYAGWTETSNFQASLLAASKDFPGSLGNVRCLAETRADEQISILEGIRLAVGYLGLPGVLPRVRARTAEDVSAFAFELGTAGLQVDEGLPLRRDTRGSEIFDFPPDREYDGDYNLVASRKRNDALTRRIRFTAGVVSHHTLQPTSPADWLNESAEYDPRATQDEYPLRGTRQSDVDPGSGVRDAAADVGIGEIDFSAAEKMMEVLLGILSTRRGIGEGECLELFRTVLGSFDTELWDTVRGWQEGGYLESFARREWRGRVLFGRRARLVVTRSESGARVTLVGLTSFALRANLNLEMLRAGAVRAPSGSVNRGVPPHQAWMVPSLKDAEEIAARLSLGRLVELMDFQSLLQPIRDLALNNGDPPLNYELRGQWDWPTRQFVPNAEQTGVRLSWFVRPDRPDCFVVTDSNNETTWTYFRNSALLVAHERAGIRPYRAYDKRLLNSAPLSQLYLPLGIARALAIRSGVIPGRLTDLETRPYSYVCLGEFDARSVESRLWGTRDINDNAQRVRWLLAQTDGWRDRSRLTAIPSALRHALESLDEIPEARALARRRIPLHLVPYVRAILRKSTS